MPRELINGVQIYYESHGHGFPLALAYGLGGNTEEWAPQLPVLSEHYRLILWDPRGHGRSESPQSREHYGLAISARDLLGLMDRLDIPRAYVGGLSMGGGIATRFTLAHPERVEALLIIDSASASGLPASSEGRAMREKTIELALNEGMKAVAEYAIESNPNIAGRATKGADAVKGLMDMYLGLDPVGYAHSVRAILDFDPITEKLSEIRAPTLVLAGQDDPALPAARATHERIAGSKLVVIPDAGHLSNLDQPEGFNKEVLGFLTAVDARRRQASPR